MARHFGKRRTVVIGVLGVWGIVAFLFSAPTALGAFGISPPFMNADHLVPGARYTQTIFLVQSDPEEDVRIKGVLTIADSIRSWVTVDKGLDFVIPSGIRQFPVQITVQVPKDTSLGTYSGNLVFETVPEKSGQVTIALGVQVAINLTVGTGIYRRYEFPIIRQLDIEAGWNPRTYIKFENQGNVSESIDHANYELYDQFGSVRLAFVQKSDGFPEIPAFTTQDITIEFPINFNLGVGEYWGDVALYKDDKVVATKRAVFNVLPRGSLSSRTAQILEHIRDYWAYYAGGVLFATIGFILIKKRRRRRPH